MSHVFESNPGLNTAFGTMQHTPDQSWFRQSELGRSGQSFAVEGTDPSRMVNVTVHRFNSERVVDMIELEAGCHGEYLAPNVGYQDARVKGWHKA